MATKIVTLKNPNGDTIYPVTKADAVDGLAPEYAFKHLDTTQQITSNTKAYLTGLSYTVQDGGAYLVIVNGNIQTYNNSNTYPRVGIYVDDVRKAYTCLHVMDNPMLQLSYTVAEVITLTPGQVIKAGVENGASQVFEGNRLIVVRIAKS